MNKPSNSNDRAKRRRKADNQKSSDNNYQFKSQRSHSNRTNLTITARLRNYFLTGLIIVGPVSITIYLLLSFIRFIDSWVKPWLPVKYNPETYLPFSIPGIGLFFFIFGLMLVGFLTANLFGRTLVSYGEMLLGRMPVVRNFYSALKQIFETVLSKSNSSFQKVGIIEYPKKGIYAMVFIATDTGGEIVEKIANGRAFLSVFLPTTPNPTSGFLLFVPKEDVTILDMNVEEGAKLVISAGLVMPEKDPSEEQLAIDKINLSNTDKQQIKE